MNYIVELKESNLEISAVNKFIPRSQLLTLLLKTNDTRIQNIKLKTENDYQYMVPVEGGFLLKLDLNMVKPGLNELIFVLEKIVPGRYVKDFECKPFELTLSEENIDKNVEGNLKRLQNQITKILNKMI
jgi:hypothetical protein